jgi:hypothetical protein
MANPKIVNIPPKKWTLVQKNNNSGLIHRLLLNTKYLWTYREPGNTAPTDREEGALLFEGRETQAIIPTDGKDLYVWADKKGRIRIDDKVLMVGLDRNSVQRSAFGEILTAQYEILTGWSFYGNVNPGLVNSATGTENGGSISHSSPFAVLNSGSDPDGKAQITTYKTSRYIPGYGGRAIFTVIFDTPQENSQQVIGLIDDDNGWGFGYNGLQFGIVRLNKGTENWTYQDDWNRDLRAILNPQRGNVYDIKYEWLGFGMQYFSIENEIGDIAIVHAIAYANENTETSIGSPNLPLRAYVKNTGNTTPLILKTPSASAGIDGDGTNEALSLTLGDGVRKIISTSGVGQPVISFYNPTTWLGQMNRTFIQALRMIFACDGNKPMQFRVLANAAPTDGTFEFVEEQLSSVQVNKTFTAYTGGVEIAFFPISKSDSLPIDLVASKFKGFPGQYFTIVADTQGAQDAAVGVTFRQFL